MVTMTQPSRPRCTEPGCPIRYRGGPNRPCPLHASGDDGMAARMDAYRAAMAPPGGSDGGEQPPAA